MGETALKQVPISVRQKYYLARCVGRVYESRYYMSKFLPAEERAKLYGGGSERKSLEALVARGFIVINDDETYSITEAGRLALCRAS